jgi:CRISPR-associated endonuclease Cas1
MRFDARRANRNLSNSNEIIEPRYGVITLFGYGTSVRVDRGHLVVEDGIGAVRRSARFPRVGHGLRRVVTIGTDGMVSLAALRWLADQDACFVMLDRVGKVVATTGPVSPSDARLRRAQSLAHQSGIALSIARELISKKLVNQQRILLKYFANSSAAFAIVAARNLLAAAATPDDLRVPESRGALAYWSAWRELPIAFPNSDLRRVPSHWQIFGSRMSPLTKSPRLAVNPANAMLNYLYAVLESESLLALSALGLDPGLGVLHADTRNRNSLAHDLMEPVRPQVDALLLDWLKKSPLRREWFLEECDGNCRLINSLATRLSETAITWRRALAPFAEGIAQALLPAISSNGRNFGPATRLTQSRKREAKGIQIQVTQRQVFSLPASCKMCGVPIKTNRKYCHKCAPEASRNNIRKAAVLGRLNTHKPQAQARRAETQRRQNAALKAWNPATMPAWLDNEAYCEKIQPQLSKVTIPVLMSALSVSEPYALRIRSGACRPHPRHWMPLARICGLLSEAFDERK